MCFLRRLKGRELDDLSLGPLNVRDLPSPASDAEGATCKSTQI